ncbi:MAG: amidohydrolase family protein [Rubrivivax sp.]|nr:amidohydrolase family protein [Rubrivivax sp.]MCL4698146.1 amidohydrolase family protein [Burkholderiaceae bacterium]
MAARLEGHILTPQGFVAGVLEHEGGRITAIRGTPVADERVVRESAQPILLPGFIDLHAHGGGGHDVMDGAEAAQAVARLHAEHGTTAMLATTMTAPLDEVQSALAALGPLVREGAARASGAARWLGIHLEGPYLSPQRLGAQPAFARRATLAEVRSLDALAPIRVITLAPEVDSHLPLIGALRDAGFRVQIGHSDGRYEDGVAALAAGASGFTHVFNAMSPLHQRAPGIVGAALAHARYAELIADLVTVHEGAVHVALRAIPGLYCVSDATAAAGMPDGVYHLGRGDAAQRVHKCLGAVRLADGTLAGSSLTLDQALRNLVQIGLPLAEASRRLAGVAAQYLGLADRGRLVVGAFADVVSVDRDLRLVGVHVEGELVEPRAS